MKTKKYLIPTIYIQYIIDGDCIALNDEEIREVDNFMENIAEGWPMDPDWDTVKICNKNDVNNRRCECVKVEFEIDYA